MCSFKSLGEFGHVYKGKLTLQDGSKILVAAKTLKVLQCSYVIFIQEEPE